MRRYEAKCYLDEGYHYAVYEIATEKVVCKFKTYAPAAKKVNKNPEKYAVRRIMYYLFPEDQNHVGMS